MVGNSYLVGVADIDQNKVYITMLIIILYCKYDILAGKTNCLRDHITMSLKLELGEKPNQIADKVWYIVVLPLKLCNVVANSNCLLLM